MGSTNIPNPPNFPQLDWGHFRIWQTVDPVPWWILDRDKLEQIIAVQMESRIEAAQREVETMRKIHGIIVGKQHR